MCLIIYIHSFLLSFYYIIFAREPSSRQHFPAVFTSEISINFQLIDPALSLNLFHSGWQHIHNVHAHSANDEQNTASHQRLSNMHPFAVSSLHLVGAECFGSAPHSSTRHARFVGPSNESQSRTSNPHPSNHPDDVASERNGHDRGLGVSFRLKYYCYVGRAAFSSTRLLPVTMETRLHIG